MIDINYLRSFKLFGFAIFDFATAFLGMAILAPLLSRIFQRLHLNIPFVSWMYFTLPVGIFAHVLVDKNTPMTAYFLDPTGHYLLKLLILLLVSLGIYGIKKV